VSVSTTVNLPNQPTLGLVSYQGLSGDGFVAPHSYFQANINLLGDASGGHQVVTLVMDPRFESVIVFANIVNLAATAAGTYDMTIGFNDVTGFQIETSGDMNLVAIRARANKIWSPPPVVGAARIVAFVTNEGVGVDMNFYVLIYNFDIQASKKVPINIMLSSLPRAGDIT